MKTINLITLSALILLFASSCKRKGCVDDLATNYDSKAKVDDGSCSYPNADLTINFEHIVDGTELTMDSITYTSAAGNEYSIENLKYFISQVTILVDGGEDIVIDAAHYIDANDETTLAFETGESLSPGTYSGISFTFGLDSAKNVDSYFANAPESNMEWPDAMGGGYHYMKLEGKYDSLKTGNIKNYATHVGKVEMMGTSHRNIFTVAFTESFTIDGATEVEAHVIMDINNWFENPNSYDFNDYDAGIMMNQTAQTILNENGSADVFSLKEINLQH